jgi:hypothetical protein
MREHGILGDATHSLEIASHPEMKGPFSNCPVDFDPKSAARQNITISCVQS